MKKPEAESTEQVIEADLVKEKDSRALNMCSQCDLSFKSEEELKTHIRDMHSAPVLPCPEKERSPDHIRDLILTSHQFMDREMKRTSYHHLLLLFPPVD